MEVSKDDFVHKIMEQQQKRKKDGERAAEQHMAQLDAEKARKKVSKTSDMKAVKTAMYGVLMEAMGENKKMMLPDGTLGVNVNGNHFSIKITAKKDKIAELED